MRTLNEKLFHVNEHLTISCRSESTRSGFRHLATLIRDGWIATSAAASAKECYSNRTWERYEFQTVIRRLSHQVVSKEEQQVIKDYADNYQEDNSHLRILAGIAALGSIMCPDQKDANDWKARMIKAGLPGIDIPEDWDTLSENDKEQRLNKVIKELEAA